MAGFTCIIVYFNPSGRTRLSRMNIINLISNFIPGGIIGGAIYSLDYPIMNIYFHVWSGRDAAAREFFLPELLSAA